MLFQDLEIVSGILVVADRADTAGEISTAYPPIQVTVSLSAMISTVNSHMSERCSHYRYIRNDLWALYREWAEALALICDDVVILLNVQHQT